MSEPLHPHEALHEAADGRLGPGARAALDEHLAGCAECRAELETIRWTKAQVAAGAEAAVPDAFESWLQTALASDPGHAEGEAASPPAWRPQPQASRWRWAAAAAVAALVVLAVALFGRWRPGDIPGAVAADYRGVHAGTLPLGVRSADVAAIDAWFRGEGLRFEPRVFDLGMMQYTAVGGRMHTISGRASALFVYRGPAGQTLVCQMYEGRTADLPPPARRVSRQGIDFLVFERDGVTMVFWQEGQLVCVLTGAGDPQAVIDLAAAKAMKI